jgi:tight adherence protein B
MNDLVLISVAAFFFIAIAGVGLLLAGGGGASGGPTAKRAQAIVQRAKPEASARTRGQAAVDPGQRRKQILRTLQEQEKKKRTSPWDAAGKLKQADLNLDVKVFWAIGGGLGLLVAVLSLVLHAKPPVALMIGFVAGAGLPLWFVDMLGKRRRAKFAAGFADAVDIIVRGLRSGLPLHDCLKVIGRECTEPLSGEFRRLVEGQGMGVSLEQGLERMHERMPAPELKFFSIVLNIQQKTGGNLGEALGNLSNVLRGRRMMREKVKALSSEAVSSAAVIGCMPPAVAGLITITNPHYLQVMFSDNRGHMLLLVAGVIMTIGIVVMRKMINFKI